MEALLTYPFPGNVRELENILERALTLSEGGQIEIEDLKLPQSARAIDGAAMDASDINLDQYLEQIEKDIIVDALEKTKWNKTAAARLLGVSFRALRYRLQKLGLD